MKGTVISTISHAQTHFQNLSNLMQLLRGKLFLPFVRRKSFRLQESEVHSGDLVFKKRNRVKDPGNNTRDHSASCTYLTNLLSKWITCGSWKMQILGQEVKVRAQYPAFLMSSQVTLMLPVHRPHRMTRLWRTGHSLCQLLTLQLSCLSAGSSAEPATNQEVFQAQTQHFHICFSV